MNAVRNLMVAVAALALAAIAMPQLASAHARYKSSTPAAGDVLATSPATVTIIFTEEVQKVSGTYGIDVVDGSNASVIAGPATLDDTDRTKMSVPLKPNLVPGRYQVNWKDVSDADGDPFAGSFAFYVGVQPTSAEQATDEAMLAAGSATTPAPGQTGSAGVSTPQVSATNPSISAATITPSPTATTGGSSGGSNTGLFIGIGIVVAVVLVAAGGYVVYRGRRR